MRLLIGIAVFLAWSAGSGYWYVCQVKGLCPETASATRLASEIKPSAEIAPAKVDTVKPLPEDLPPPPAPPIPQELRSTQSLLFSFAKPILKNRGDMRDYVDKVAAFFMISQQHEVVITGYTDDTAARENNLKLGMRRAEVVAEIFRKVGVSEEQMRIESKGEQDPVATNMTRAGREKNRRVEIRIEAPPEIYN